MLVDLQKVKIIIDSFSIIGESREHIKQDLDKLAYGKIYTCWYCGGKIYACADGWYHVNSDAKECDKSSGNWVQEYRATPKPDDLA